MATSSPRGMGRKLQHTDPAVSKMVRRFCNYLARLRAIHNIYKKLYENDEAKQIMEKTAQSFFVNLNVILNNYLLLEFAKITDPEASIVKGKIEENFTVNNLIMRVDWPKNIMSKLEPLRKEANTFRDYIKNARDKLLAHLDKETFLNGKVLGGFPLGKEEKFLSVLEEICNITHEACFNSIYGSISVSMEGDVEDLKKALKRALVFDRVFSESKGEEKAKLFKYLREKL